MVLRIIVLLITSCSLLAILNLAQAAKPFPDAPLLPGTKVVAGDLGKDEFFIVADNDDVMKVKQPVIETIKKGTSDKAPVITLAEKKPAVHKPLINVADKINSALKKAAEHKATGLTQLALNKVPEYHPPSTTPPNNSKLKKAVNEEAELISVALNQALQNKNTIQTQAAVSTKFTMPKAVLKAAMLKSSTNKNAIFKIKKAVAEVVHKPASAYVPGTKTIKIASKKQAKKPKKIAKNKIFTVHIKEYSSLLAVNNKQPKPHIIAATRQHKKLAKHKHVNHTKMALR